MFSSQQMATRTPSVKSFSHRCRPQTKIIVFNVPTNCPMCGEAVVASSVTSPVVQYPSPFVSASGVPFSLVIKPTVGDFLMWVLTVETRWSKLYYYNLHKGPKMQLKLIYRNLKTCNTLTSLIPIVNNGLNPSKSTDMSLCRIPATLILQNHPIWVYAGCLLPQSFKINRYEFMQDPYYLNPSKSTDMSLCRMPAASILQHQPIFREFMQDPCYLNPANSTDMS